jgi:hypothetical protein
MHNPTTYKATFSKLRMHAFGKEQTLAYKGEVEIYQARDNPELWRARPAFETGRHKWEAPTAKALAAVIQDDFEFQLTHWIAQRGSGPALPRVQPENVIMIDSRRRA